MDMRDFCWRCHRVSSLCLCSKVRPFEWEPLLAVLIHPKEYKKTIGTARLVKLSVKESVSWIGCGPDFDENEDLQKFLADPTLFPVVLFPGNQSVNLSRPAPAWLPANRRLAVLVVDASWSLAKKMIERSQTLSVLPRISFDVGVPSTYRFRRQPAKYCLSTVEAIHLLIENLHRAGVCGLPQGNAHHAMLDAFDYLVETQIRSAESE